VGWRSALGTRGAGKEVCPSQRQTVAYVRADVAGRQPSCTNTKRRSGLSLVSVHGLPTVRGRTMEPHPRVGEGFGEQHVHLERPNCWMVPAPTALDCSACRPFS
jgi:hypothetical protein